MNHALGGFSQQEIVEVIEYALHGEDAEDGHPHDDKPGDAGDFVPFQ